MNEFEQIKKDIEESIKVRGYVHVTIIDRWLAYTESLLPQDPECLDPKCICRSCRDGAVV